MSDVTSVTSVTSSAAVLGGVLARLRKAKGMTQEDLGKAVDVGATTWSRIEQGSSQLSTAQLRLAAKALGVTAASILSTAEAIEGEMSAHGIVVGDVPPKEWSDFTGSGFLGGISKYLRGASVFAGAAALVGGLGGGLLIPIAGAALGGLISKYWPKDEEADTKSP